ncbi:hypothetical protein B0T09DRAFT_334310 [Sordaria sp. MPI-SDFR-AT-0083]|nr:hypothetical protein B0T09DRAFT_334310 [Sordaria sp. MPI-SDFR-AT-0083]
MENSYSNFTVSFFFFFYLHFRFHFSLAFRSFITIGRCFTYFCSNHTITNHFPRVICPLCKFRENSRHYLLHST